MYYINLKALYVREDARK